MRRILLIFIILALAALALNLGVGTIERMGKVDFHVQGTVLDHDGSPLEGCRVLLFFHEPGEEELRDALMASDTMVAAPRPAEGEEAPFSQPPYAFGITGSQGRYELRLSLRYSIRGTSWFGCSSVSKNHPFVHAWLVYVAPARELLVRRVNCSDWPPVHPAQDRSPIRLEDATLALTPEP